MIHKLKRMLTDKMGRPILQYFDEKTQNFQVQPEIANEETVKEIEAKLSEQATEKTLQRIEHRLSEKNDSVKDVPHLSNIRWVENGMFVNWFHDGFFYSSWDTFLYRSENGINWMEIHDFDTVTGIKIVLVSDTNRFIVTTFGGEVFISDEDGVFNSEPSFVTEGSFDERWGHFKYGNIIGLNTYSGHGLTRAHEAFLSTDNGATFKKVFDNSNFDDLPLVSDYVHLHDMDYDPYSGRLYLWSGDGPNRSLMYSDDFGETWKLAFERGAVPNHTQIISTPNGIALGIDGAPGGVSYVHIDRSKRINPPLDINMVEPKFWSFSDDGKRYVANRKWVDRNKNIYLIPYTGENDDGNHGAIAFSRDGYKWQLLHKSTAKGHYYGIYGVQYGNGKLVAMQKDVDDKFRIMIADVDLES